MRYMTMGPCAIALVNVYRKYLSGSISEVTLLRATSLVVAIIIHLLSKHSLKFRRINFGKGSPVDDSCLHMQDQQSVQHPGFWVWCCSICIETKLRLWHGLNWTWSPQEEGVNGRNLKSDIAKHGEMMYRHMKTYEAHLNMRYDQNQSKHFQANLFIM